MPRCFTTCGAEAATTPRSRLLPHPPPLASLPSSRISRSPLKPSNTPTRCRFLVGVFDLSWPLPSLSYPGGSEAYRRDLIRRKARIAILCHCIQPTMPPLKLTLPVDGRRAIRATVSIGLSPSEVDPPLSVLDGNRRTAVKCRNGASVLGRAARASPASRLRRVLRAPTTMCVRRVPTFPASRHRVDTLKVRM